MEERLRLARSYFDYASQPKITRTACPCCATPTGVPDEALDRCGHPVTVYRCPDCTLTYLVDIMTPEGYAALYAGDPSPYRQIAWRFASVKPFDPVRNKVFTDANVAKYIEALEKFLGYHRFHEVQLLDVGGSMGGVRPGAVVLDLAGDELKPGANSICSSLEDWRPIGQYKGILLCRTLDHLWDPLVGLQKLRQVIEPDGWLFVDYSSQNVLKIDHTTYWTLPSLVRLLERTGWKVWPGVFNRRYTYGVLCSPS